MTSSSTIALVVILAAVPRSALADEANDLLATQRFEEQNLTVQPGPATDLEGAPAPHVRILQGNLEHELTQRQFLALVGRSDLLRTREPPAPNYGLNLVLGGTVLGVSTILIGAALIAASSGDPSAGCPASSLSACENQRQNQFDQDTLVGTMLMTLGSLAMTGMITWGVLEMSTGATPPAKPEVTADLEQRLVESYNRTLRHNLGLPDRRSDAHRQEIPAIQWSVAPAILRSGAGLLVRAEF